MIAERPGEPMIDLTHRLRQGMPHWPNHARFGLALVESVATGGVCCHHAVSLGEHTGTHLDAPKHFLERDGAPIDQMPLSAMFGRLATIDVTGMAAGGLVQPEQLTRWERAHGGIAPGDAVGFHFGWDRHFSADPVRFLAGWPGLSQALCEALVARGVRLVATDCISIDSSGQDGYAAHYTLLGAGILIGENFNNLGLLPPLCAVATLPLPIEGGTGAPIRAIAFPDRVA